MSAAGPAEAQKATPGEGLLLGRYGEAPQALGTYAFDEWGEFLHYQYLPVRIPARDRNMPADEPLLGDDVRLPRRLAFLRDAVDEAIADARRTCAHLRDPYVYVTAKRRHAQPGNPLNRPGWHADNFGADSPDGTTGDLNYVWADRYPTRLLLSDDPLTLSGDDTESMLDMEGHAETAEFRTRRWNSARQFNGNAPRPASRIEHAPLGTLLRLTPWVIHTTPEIPAPGGMRSFLKISVSAHRFDLRGNSHNHAFDYDWAMVDRATLRNHPSAFQNRDYSGGSET